MYDDEIKKSEDYETQNGSGGDEAKKNQNADKNSQKSLKDNNNVASHFTNLPIGQLICAPFIEMARGQAELCEVYIQTLFQIAFKDAKSATFDNSNETRILKFSYTRPIVDELTGNVTPTQFEVDVPLLSLVPIPAFTLNSADVSFDMEVNVANTQTNTTTEELSSNVKFGFWGISGNIAGKVTNSSSGTFNSSQKATYKIEVHAIQQPAAEGMEKLTALLSETMEPITIGASQ